MKPQTVFTMCLPALRRNLLAIFAGARRLWITTLAMIACLVQQGLALDIVWTNTVGGGNWNVATNWDPNLVPGAGDHAVITNDGTYIVALNVNATVARLTLGGSAGAQTLVINGPTLTLNGPSVVNSNGVVELRSGNLSGSGLLTVGAYFAWSGGTMSGGSTLIAEGATLMISGDAQKTLSGRSVTNLGTVVWSGAGRIFTQGAAVFANEVGGVFEVQNDVGYEEDGWNPGGVFRNSGLFRKSGGSGTTTFSGIDFENTGTVETLSGRIAFPHGVTSGGVFLAGAGATNLFNGTCLFRDGSRLGGMGQNVLQNVTVTLDGAIGATNLVFASGTWLGTNWVSGGWQWTGGVLSGPGSTTLAAGSLLEITGGLEKTLKGRSVTNLGTVVWSGAGRIFTQGAAVFVNEVGGVFEVQNDVGYEEDGWQPGGVFRNAGLFRKSGGSGTTTFSGVDFENTGTVEVASGTLKVGAAFDNGGLVQVVSGRLELSGGGTSGGRIEVATNQVVLLTGGTHTLNTGSVWQGGGTYRIAGATVSVVDSASVERMELASGTLGGKGVMEVTNLLVWSGGTMSGGSTLIAEGATLMISGDAQKTLSGRSVTNLGTVVWSGAGRIFTQGAAVFANEVGGVFEVQNDVGYEEDGWNPGGVFRNAGLFRKSGGSGTTTFSGIEFENTGTVETLSGRIAFPHGVTSGGVFLAGAGATNLFNGTCLFRDGSRLGGMGQNVLQNVTVTLDGAIGATNLVFASGTWLGTNWVSGGWQWTGGVLSGPGSTTLAAGSLLEITGGLEKTLKGRSVTNLGTVVWSGEGRIFTQGAAVFANEAGGVFEVQNDVGYEEDGWNPGGVFRNAGLFRKSGGSGTTTFSGVDFENTGTVEVASGTLKVGAAFDNGGLVQVVSGRLELSGGGTSGGRMEVATNQVVLLTGGTHTLNKGSVWQGAGTYRIAGATVSVVDSAGVDRMELASGTLGGKGVMEVTSSLVWSGGTMSGGSTLIAEGATLMISGDAQKTLSGRSVTNLGTVVWSGAGRIFTQGAAVFANEVGGVFEVQNDVGYEEDGWNPGGVFRNAGLFRKSGGSGTTTFSGIEFENTGTVETLSGRIAFPHGVTSGGVFLAGAGATNLFNGTCLFRDGSRLGGMGQNVLQNVTVTLDGAIGATNLVFASGTWLGTNWVSGGWQWTGGVLSGPGSTTLAAGSLLEITGGLEKTLKGRSVTNLGTVVWSGAGRIFTQGVAVFANEAGGVFEVQNDVGYEEDGWNPGGVFRNAGLFRKSGGSGTTTFSGIDFENTGTLSVWRGVIRFGAGLQLGGSSTVEFALAGLNHPEDHGRITSSLSLPLRGQLAVTFRNGFVPGFGQHFDVITAPIVGTFSTFNVPAISMNVFMNPVYLPNLVRLVTLDPTPILSGQPTIDNQGRLELTIQGIANQLYVVQATTNFTTWVGLETNAIPASTIWRFVDEDSAVLPYRFYRVLFTP